MKLSDLLEYQAALFGFDFKQKSLPVSFYDSFRLNRDMPHSRVTRQSDHLYIPKSHNVFADKLPLFHIPRMWNKWATAIPYEVTRGQFKRQMKANLFSGYPETVKYYRSTCQPLVT